MRQVRTSWLRQGEETLTDSGLPDESSPLAAELFEALTAEARPHELVGLAEPLSLFRAQLAQPTAATASTRRSSVLTTLIGARAGAAVAGVAIGLGATSFVAYSATRPPTEPAIISPATATATATPSPDVTSSERPVGPDATGPAAFGLCNAWANQQKGEDGSGRAKDSTAMRNLAAAAGGESKIATYCATTPHPGNGPKDRNSDKDGKPAKNPDRSVGPDATGPAAFGLCNAWANQQKRQDGSGRAEDSTAMRNLAAAAGGESKIAAYCATIPHPGNGPKDRKTGK